MTFRSPIKICRQPAIWPPTTKYLLLTSRLSDLYRMRLFQVVAHQCKVQIILIKYYHFSNNVVPLITTFQLRTASLRRFSGDNNISPSHKLCTLCAHVMGKWAEWMISGPVPNDPLRPLLPITIASLSSSQKHLDGAAFELKILAVCHFFS